jgi:hypothetical protein
VSAPALHPSARMRPVLLERLERQRVAHCLAALGLAGCAVWLRVDSVEVTWSAAVVGVLLGGFFLPFWQKIGPEDQPVWDAFLPVDPARYALARLLCGVAGAAFLLAVLVGLYVTLLGDSGHPEWYPLALLAWGLTCYLLTSAALLRPMHPAISALSVVVLLAAGMPFVLAWFFEEPAELGRMGVTAVLTRTVFPLGLAGAAAYVASRFPRRATETAGPAARHLRAAWRELAGTIVKRPAPLATWPAPLPNRAAPPSVCRASPARPAAAFIVFGRHFALLLRFAMLAAPFLGVLVLFILTEPILDVNQGGEGPTVRWFVSATDLGDWCAGIAISWSVLVWVAEYGARRRWNDMLPVGTTKRRILHATAGSAWLLLFITVVVAATLGRLVAAGMLASAAESPAWLWLGLPVRTLTLYLATTLVLFGPRLALKVSPFVVYVLIALRVDRVVPLMIVMMTIGIVGVPYGVLVLGIDLLESQAGVVAGHAGSEAASMLWLVMYAAAAAIAIALDDWIHRLDRLPTVPELRGVLNGWAGTRPGRRLQEQA